MKKALMLGVLGSLIAQGSNSMDLRHSNEKTMMAMRQNMHCNQPAKGATFTQRHTVVQANAAERAALEKRQAAERQAAERKAAQKK